MSTDRAGMEERSYTEFMTIMHRIQGYINLRIGTFKVSKLFIRNGVVDEEALALLREFLVSPFVWENILDVQCNVKFQLSGQKREIVLTENSAISSLHCENIWSYLLSKPRQRPGRRKEKVEAEKLTPSTVSVFTTPSNCTSASIDTTESRSCVVSDVSARVSRLKGSKRKSAEEILTNESIDSLVDFPQDTGNTNKATNKGKPIS